MHFCRIMVVSLPYTGNKILSLSLSLSLKTKLTFKKRNIDKNSRVCDTKFFLLFQLCLLTLETKTE